MIVHSRRFSLDIRGNIAILTALAIVPLLLIAGGMIDYSRAASARVFLQKALDSALLRIVSDPVIAAEDREEAIRHVLAGLMKERSSLVPADFIFSDANGVIQVSASSRNKNVFGGILGRKETDVTATSAVTVGGQQIEVALVLDLTGSMRNDMVALRRSASDLVEALMSRQHEQGVRISVVPYVATVNVGAGNLRVDQIDVDGRSRWHARHVRWQWIGRIVNCKLNSDDGGNNLVDPGKPTGGDKSGSLLQSLSNFAVALFGVAPARAEVTPSTRKPLQGQWITVPHVNGGTTTAFLPTGFNQIDTCWMANPAVVSHVDLFNRIPNATWKGCVEARPEPYDVLDTSPDPHNSDTLFVPYFWHDETDDGHSWWNYANNYMPDGDLPQGWVFHDHWQRNFPILKYDGVTPATIVDTPPFTKGPNAGCPNEVLPLTGDKDAILGMISSLQHWESGGTITSEGIAWGWRTLSPNQPFTQAKPYGETVKIMVVMTDGKNSFVANDVWGPTISEYTAYGYLRGQRFPNFSFADVEKYLNNRHRLVCENVKREGIQIYSILFNETDITARMLMQQCASSTDKFFYATSHAELASAFKSIGEAIGSIRLVQ
jgi:Flp pilus assembly protein TadG